MTDSEIKFRGWLMCFISNLSQHQWKKIIACSCLGLTAVQGGNFSTESCPDRGSGLIWGCPLPLWNFLREFFLWYVCLPPGESTQGLILVTLWTQGLDIVFYLSGTGWHNSFGRNSNAQRTGKQEEMDCVYLAFWSRWVKYDHWSSSYKCLTSGEYFWMTGRELLNEWATSWVTSPHSDDFSRTKKSDLELAHSLEDDLNYELAWILSLLKFVIKILSDHRIPIRGSKWMNAYLVLFPEPYSTFPPLFWRVYFPQSLMS